MLLFGAGSIVMIEQEGERCDIELSTGTVREVVVVEDVVGNFALRLLPRPSCRFGVEDESVHVGHSLFVLAQ